MVGALFLAFTAFCFIMKYYTWVWAGLFIGLFLLSSSYKRIRFLLRARKAFEAGSKEIVIFYRDKNLKESQNVIMPAGADASWFYGFLLDKKDIKAFRWERIQKALEDGKELKKDGILERLAN